MVDHGRTGLHFEPGNAVALASAVRQLLADQPALKEMRQAARQEYEQQFTAEANYHTLRAIYQRVLADGQRKRARTPCGERGVRC